MSVPVPNVPLVGQCSVIYNNTLYTYQPNAFQSLPLEVGASWQQLPSGVAVSQAQCVLGKLDNQDALFIVGGVTNSTNLSYPGLQSYNFAQKTWSNSTAPGPYVTQNRQGHGAAWLRACNAIVLYAGFQDNSFRPSSQTFTLSTVSPYTMRSFTSAAPPVENPQLAPWNDTHVAMFGGNPTSQAIWLFNPDGGWHRLDDQLPAPIPDRDVTQVAVLHDTSGATVLDIVNLGTSPNTVSTVEIHDAAEHAAARNAVDLHVSRRDINTSQLPAYNASQAPQGTRSGASLAHDDSGLMVIAGGASGQNTPSIAMFNASGNSWVDAKQFFSGSTQTSSSAPTSTSAPSSTTASPSPSSATSAPAQSSGDAPGPDPRSILGGVLGGICGFAALCILALLLFRCRRARRHRQQNYIDPDNSSLRNLKADESGFGTANHSAASSYDMTRAPPVVHAPSQKGRKGYGVGGTFDKGNISNPYLVSDSSDPRRVVAKHPPRLGPTAMVSERSPRLQHDEGWGRFFATEPPSKSNHAGTAAAAAAGLGVGAVAAKAMSKTHADPQTARTTQYTQSDYGDSRMQSMHPPLPATIAGAAGHTTTRDGDPPTQASPAYRGPAAISHAQQHPAYRGSPQAMMAQSASHHHADDYALDADESPPPSPSENPDNYLHPASSSSGGAVGWDPLGPASSSAGETGSSSLGLDHRPSSSMYVDNMHPFAHHPGERVRLTDFPAVPRSSTGSALAGGSALAAAGVGASSRDGNGNTSMGGAAKGNNAQHAERGMRTIASKDFFDQKSFWNRPGASQARASHSRGAAAAAAAAAAGGKPRQESDDMSWLNLSK